MEPSFLPQGATSDTVALAMGNPAVEALPWDSLQQAGARALALPRAHQALQYGDEQGVPELITYLADKVSRTEGILVAPQNVMITAGSTGAVDMIARLYAHRTGVVLVEAPTYRDVLQVFRDQHLRLVSVAIDDDGPMIEPLRALLERLHREQALPSVFYTIPTFHNPGGITASLERRQAVIDLCQQYGVLIVEDDVYRDISFDKKPPPSYYALAGGVGVVSVGSFSKTLAPGLRLGWIVAAEGVIQTCINSGSLQMGGGANPLVASLVTEYCQQGLWEAHIDGLRELYGERRDAMLVALAAHMPPDVTWTKPNGGYFVWLTLPQAVDGGWLAARAKAAGVLIAPGHSFFAEGDPHTRHIRLSFSYAQPEAITQGIAALAGVVRDLTEGA
ncbi:MAG: PLP-dependent aminotransferase family protein [Anaerolineae bacterium]